MRLSWFRYNLIFAANVSIYFSMGICVIYICQYRYNEVLILVVIIYIIIFCHLIIINKAKFFVAYVIIIVNH